jgi:hypothetical protein
MQMQDYLICSVRDIPLTLNNNWPDSLNCMSKIIQKHPGLEIIQIPIPIPL